MKKLILIFLVTFQISVQAQVAVHQYGKYQIKVFDVRTQTRTYKVSKYDVPNSVPNVVDLSVRPTDYVLPKLSPEQMQMADVGANAYAWDKDRIIKIIEEEFKKSRSKFNAEAFYKGKTFFLSITGDPNTLRILNINFGFQSDYIKDFTLIESIDNRIREEIVVKPKKMWADFRKIPIYKFQCGIPVEKIKI